MARRGAVIGRQPKQLIQHEGCSRCYGCRVIYKEDNRNNLYNKASCSCCYSCRVLLLKTTKTTYTTKQVVLVVMVVVYYIFGRQPEQLIQHESCLRCACCRVSIYKEALLSGKVLRGGGWLKAIPNPTKAGLSIAQGRTNEVSGALGRAARAHVAL